MMQNLINIDKIKDLIPILLQDKATGKNIIFATDDYVNCGEDYGERVQITVEKILNNPDIICPRALKSKAEQIARTRKKAEVFTPAWLVNKMNNFLDEDLSEKNVDWQKYVKTKILEITCGEAPFLVTRYDAATGELIDVDNRIGILDRKLRVVSENVKVEYDWIDWAFKAFESVYGYEYQGDNVLIARINLLYTFVEHFKNQFGRDPHRRHLRHLANKIAWNIWQMDGLVNPPKEDRNISLFDEMYTKPKIAISKIKNWRSKFSFDFMDLTEGNVMKKKFFDYVIGNPPYNEDFDNSGDNGNFAKPVYNDFIDAARKVADKVELIHPARFLFNAGSTLKSWNKKMLNDPHFKVLTYEADSSKFFSNTDIKGGVAITYSDSEKDFGAIGTFTAFNELNGIIQKVVTDDKKFHSLNEIMYSSESYHFTDKMHEDFPNAKNLLSKGHAYDLKTNVFEKLTDVFLEEKPQNGNDYIQIYGKYKIDRVYRWIRSDYINNPIPLNKFKVLIPQSNGSGAIGEVLSTPLIGTPLIGTTQTFISVGAFDTKEEAEACLKYVKTKFARTMLGTLKITQHNPPATWANVPLQDFTENSDIDWTQSVAEIDRELYKKYSLSENEIEFIEAKVKEMV